MMAAAMRSKLPRRPRWTVCAVWMAASLACAAATWLASESVPEIFRDADLPLGSKLLAEHRCAECHIRRVGGDGSAIYRPQGRIHSPGALRGMVEMCNTELKLQLFPEEVTAIAAVLERDHYRVASRERRATPTQPR